MKEDTQKLFAIVGIILSTLIAIILIPLIGGFVVQILWGWFIVTTFHLKPLTIAQAIGLSILVRYFTYNSTPASKDTSVVKTLGMTIGSWVFTLLFAFIVHLFI